MFRRVVNYSRLFIMAAFLAACGTMPAAPSPTPVLQQPTADSNNVRLANGFWPPYNGENLPHGGCDSLIVEEAFALEGLSVTYGFFPWVRSYSFSATGNWDGTLAWDDTPEHREQHYISAEPTSVQEWVFFYRVDQPLTWKTLNDLAGKTIGITTGYVYSDAFKELRQKGTVTFLESSSDDSNFKMLLAGRIDVFPIERRVGRYIMKTIFTPEEQAQITDSPNSFAEFHSYLLLSKAIPQNEQRILQFNSGLKKLKQSGRYAEILKSCES